MTQNKRADTEKYIKPQNTRPTIGFLSGNVYARVSLHPNILWSGILDTAREQDANLICFAGGALGVSPDTNLALPRNVLYDLVASDNVDGLVISSGTLGLYASAEEVHDFCNRYRHLPLVSIAAAIEGVPSVLVDNVTGLRDAVSHLIETHGHRRIAFVHGPEGHEEAEARYGAYTEALAAHGLDLNPDLVLPGHFDRAAGAAAIHLLLDERKLRPRVDFEAVVASSDAAALGALGELQARGIQVPYDVAVVGFDDVTEAGVSTPSLTTVRQPIHEQGQRAVELLLALLAGKEVPEQVVLPTELVLRQSCGCHSQVVLQATAEPAVGAAPKNSDETFEVAFAARREEILAVMVQAVADYSDGTASASIFEQAEQLLDGFAAAMRGGAPANFLSTLDQVLRQVIVEGYDPSLAGPQHGSEQSVNKWQAALSVLRSQVRSWLGDGAELSRAENLWQQARLFIAEAAQQVQQYQQLQAEQQAGVLQEIGQAMITTFDLDALMDVMARELPRLGIPSTYLALYEGQGTPPQESRLILAYDENGRTEVAVDRQRFSSRALVPEGLLPQERGYRLVVEALHFKDNQLGFVLLEAGPRDGAVYETLQGQISSALQGALLMEQEEKRARQLQTVAEVSTATSTILDTAILLQKVVDLTKERFGLYHAHIYLLNESGDTLNLTAGAGEAGRKMVAEGWRIALVQEQSLVARAARSGKTVTVDNVRLAADWLPNPLLPDTYAEMAVPIMLEDKVVGVLDVQSDKIGGLNEGDANLLRSLANHVAVTLSNVRLFEETQEALTETSNLYQASRKINEAGDLQEMMMAVAEASSVSQINGVMLGIFGRGSLGEIDTLVVTANWHGGQGSPPPAVGVRFPLHMLPYKDLIFSLEPIFVDDVLHDERLDFESMAAIQETHIQSMAILPLGIGDRQLGVLLLRAEEVHRFTNAERRLYTSLARQVAVAVENQRLLAETQSVLAELEATQRQYTIRSWDSYRKRSSILDYEQVRFGGASVTEDTVEGQHETSQDVVLLTDGNESASPTNGSIQQDDASLPALPAERETKLVVPLRVRGEEIGVLGIAETAEQRKWSPEEIALVEAIAEQVAQAAENLRLIDETQQAAAREVRVNEIGEKIRSAQSLEEALRVAVREVGISLKVSQTAVQLKVND